MRWNGFRIGGVAFERKDIPQDERITDPQDGRLAGLPEWVPRPGETAVINTIKFTVKAVRLTDDSGVVYIDTENGSKRLTKEDVNAIGTRYRYEPPRTSHPVPGDPLAEWRKEYYERVAQVWTEQGREVGVWYKDGDNLTRLNEDGSVDDEVK